MNFDQDKATKLWEPRPQNIRYVPQKGDIWLYFDADQERTVIRWLIEEVNDDTVQLKKMSGKDVGYVALYPIKKMDDKDWRPEGEPEGGTVYLWPCPGCEEDHPVLEGDYLCTKCRT